MLVVNPRHPDALECRSVDWLEIGITRRRARRGPHATPPRAPLSAPHRLGTAQGPFLLDNSQLIRVMSPTAMVHESLAVVKAEIALYRTGGGRSPHPPPRPRGSERALPRAERAGRGVADAATGAGLLPPQRTPEPVVTPLAHRTSSSKTKARPEEKPASGGAENQ